MKPFNMKEATDDKKRVITRNGEKVVILGVIPAQVDYPVVGYRVGSQESDSWTLTGRYYKHSSTDHSLDLVMETTAKEGWIAYGMEYEPDTHDGLLGFATHVWPTEEQAVVAFREGTSLEPKGTQKVSWEE